jgi:hypothetical protein
MVKIVYLFKHFRRNYSKESTEEKKCPQAEIVKKDTYPKYSGSSILLCSVQYCDQQFTVSSKIL